MIEVDYEELVVNIMILINIIIIMSLVHYVSLLCKSHRNGLTRENSFKNRMTKMQTTAICMDIDTFSKIINCCNIIIRQSCEFMANIESDSGR